jgi:hypothetical protein
MHIQDIQFSVQEESKDESRQKTNNTATAANVALIEGIKATHAVIKSTCASLMIARVSHVPEC